MKISNVLARSPVKPMASPTTMRWPVEDTGRNSVRPSTTPRISAWSSSRFMGSVETQGLAEYAGANSAAVEHHAAVHDRHQRPAAERAPGERRPAHLGGHVLVTHGFHRVQNHEREVGIPAFENL